MRTWMVLDCGKVPDGADTIPFPCPGCGVEAALPVVGRAVAMIHGGPVFDPGERAVPLKIQCRSCRRSYEAA